MTTLPKFPLQYGKEENLIRVIAAYAAKRAGQIGAENVFNFSIGNPNVPAPARLTEALHEILPEAKQVFRLSGKGMAAPDIPDYVVRIPRNGLAMMREMATSRVIVTNAGMKTWMKKFPDQYYI